MAEVQLRVELWPAVIDVGEALRFTVGAGVVVPVGSIAPNDGAVAER